MRGRAEMTFSQPWDCSRTFAQPVANTDLIAFLQALPEGRRRRGVRYPHWLLVWRRRAAMQIAL